VKNIFKLIIIVVPATFFIFFYFYLSEDKTYPGLQTDEFAFPNFYLETLDDEKVFLNEQDLPSTGLLNVWASWCITCLVEHPFLMNLKEKDIKIIGLNYKDERFDAQNWLNKYGDPYSEVLYDPKGSLALDLGVTGAPETFLIHNGKIIAHYSGEINERVWAETFLPIINKNNIKNL